MKKLPWVRHMAVVAMPELVDHNPGAIVATVFAAAVGKIAGEVG